MSRQSACQRALAGVVECTLPGVAATSEPLRGLRSVPFRRQLSQVSEASATLAKLWGGIVDVIEQELPGLFEFEKSSQSTKLKWCSPICLDKSCLRMLTP